MKIEKVSSATKSIRDIGLGERFMFKGDRWQRMAVDAKLGTEILPFAINVTKGDWTARVFDWDETVSIISSEPQRVGFSQLENGEAFLIHPEDPPYMKISAEECVGLENGKVITLIPSQPVMKVDAVVRFTK